jgi:hypothetical protein
MKEWQEIGSQFSDYFKAGCLVDESVIEYFRDILPPAFWQNGILQVGEPADHRYDKRTGKDAPIFSTFLKYPEGWRYKGRCFLGEIEERYLY